MVSANGHVLKTVKGKAIGEVQIVDDKANVAVERGDKVFFNPLPYLSHKHIFCNLDLPFDIRRKKIKKMDVEYVEFVRDSRIK